MKKRPSLLLAIAMLLSLLGGCSTTTGSDTKTESLETIASTASPAVVQETAAPESPAFNTTVDVIGRTVAVPANAQHVVLLPGPALEKALLLGVADRLSGVYKSSVNDWSKLVHPSVANLTLFESSKTPGVETILSLGAEFVICHDYPELTPVLEEAGIPYVVTQCSGALPYEELEGFLDFQKTEVMAIANAFGGDAVTQGEDWCNYFDEKVSYVRSRTEAIAEEERPIVYYARSDEGLVTFSRNSYPHYLVELAGGYYVAKDTPVEMNSNLTIEKIMEWNPDIIFMGRMNDTAIITDNPAWSGIKAVEDGAVYLCPSGVFNWDYSGESVLLMLYLAKTIHPELFEDLNMEEEIKYYYSHFYGFELSDENVQNILNHAAPVAQ